VCTGGDPPPARDADFSFDTLTLVLFKNGS
jgi:hypothetical protein